MHAINALMSAHWAIAPDVLMKMKEIADRAVEKGDLLALEKFRGGMAEGTKESWIRDGVAVLPVSGPMFRYANALAHVCQDVTSYQMVAKDLHRLTSDPAVHTIILDIDSPGGECNGCLELGKHIKEASQKKKVITYIGGMGCSAAYWIASATSEIVASESSEVGSIGAIYGFWKPDSRGKEFNFISSVSPNKNRDPETDEGAKLIQERVDDMGSLFVDNVAENRGKSRKEVLEKFGQGHVFIAKKALERGMIDKISTLENLIAEHSKKEEKNLDKEELKAKHPELYRQVQEEARSSFNGEEIKKTAAAHQIARIKSVLSVGATVPEYLMACIDDPVKDEKDAAFALWEQQKNQQSQTQAAQQQSDKTAGSDYLQAVAEASNKINLPVNPEPSQKDESKDAIDQIMNTAETFGLRGDEIA